MSEKRTNIGGQAVIEGVMMRGEKIYAMAVRNPDGEIVIEKTGAVLEKKAFSNTPFSAAWQPLWILW